MAICGYIVIVMSIHHVIRMRTYLRVTWTDVLVESCWERAASRSPDASAAFVRHIDNWVHSFLTQRSAILDVAEEENELKSYSTSSS